MWQWQVPYIGNLYNASDCIAQRCAICSVLSAGLAYDQTNECCVRFESRTHTLYRITYSITMLKIAATTQARNLRY